MANRFLALTFQFIAPLVLCGALAEAEDIKLPVPDAAAQDQAAELVKNVFKADYEAAKTSQDRVALAAKMLKVAAETKDDPPGRFALLTVAKDLAAGEGDLNLVQSVVAELGKSFRVDELVLLRDALTVVARASRDKELQAKIAQLALSLVDRAEEADRYSVAKELGEAAIESARDARDTALIKRIQARMEIIEQLDAAHRETEESRLTLVDKPTDPAANLAVGKFYGYLKGQWEKAIPMLALGSDPKLQELAKKELQGVASAEEQATLGDGWWELSEAAEGLAQEHLREHTAFLYAKAAPKLAGLRKAAVEKRLAEVQPQAESPSLPEGAVLLFTFEEKTFFRQAGAVLVKDLSGAGNHGLVVAAQPAPGKAGTALSFDGKNAYVECAITESLNLTKAFTISVWINARSWRNADVDYIVSQDDWKGRTSRGFVLRGSNNGQASVTVGDGQWHPVSSKERLAPGEWRHLAATFGDGQLSIYVDGALKNSVKAPASLVPSTHRLRIGRGSFAPDRAFHGVIDEVAIFNRALTADEVKAIYRMGVQSENLAE
jgi:hypothetical protein